MIVQCCSYAAHIKSVNERECVIYKKNLLHTLKCLNIFFVFALRFEIDSLRDLISWDEILRGNLHYFFFMRIYYDSNENAVKMRISSVLKLSQTLAWLINNITQLLITYMRRFLLRWIFQGLEESSTYLICLRLKSALKAKKSVPSFLQSGVFCWIS